MQKYKIIELSGVLFGLAALLLTFMIVPPLFLAPPGIIFSSITIKKNRDKRLGILGLILSIIPLIIVSVLYFSLKNLQIGP
ncbi:MAG TPA: hypothetical protein VLG47_00220 [Candidatus Saccharimonadales bacterium]|nr:hypothetical protein [Candidatus Saccharimonadales bacterium]